MHDSDSTPAQPSIRPTFYEMATSALGFWEPMRVVYNVVLAAVVVGFFVAYWPGSREFVALRHVPEVFMLAVMANVCYCAAYPVDLFVQYSAFRSLWQRLRWVLFLIGTLFAAALAAAVLSNLFFTLEIMNNRFD